MEFCGNQWIPWDSIDCMQFHALHGSLWNVGNSIESFEIPLNSMNSKELHEVHGNPWKSNPWIPWIPRSSTESMEFREFHGIQSMHGL